MTPTADLQLPGLARDGRFLLDPPTNDEVVYPDDDGDASDGRGRTILFEGTDTLAPDPRRLSVASVELAFGASPAGLALDFSTAFAAAPGPDQPQENGSGGTTATVLASGDDWIDGLLSGVRWADATISYSDPNSVSDYQTPYPEWFSNFQQIDANQLHAVHAALNSAAFAQPTSGVGYSVEGFTNLTIDYAGSGTGVGTIRLANTSDPDTAHYYAPNTDAATGGDVFFGGAGRAPVAGNLDHFMILKVLGHSLGLKHGHDDGVGYGALPYGWDSMEYSVMSDRSYEGGSVDGYFNEAFGYAQTFMMLDIAALQHMYGADFITNAGDTNYSWNPLTGQSYVNGAVALTPGANRIFQTIWDGGGVDAYDLSNYTTGVSIDLMPGRSSFLSHGQLADLGGETGNRRANGNVFNALQYGDDTRSLIENAYGGSNDDNIVGSYGSNIVYGNSGDDHINGIPTLTGVDQDELPVVFSDVLYGGQGNDTIEGGAYYPYNFSGRYYYPGGNDSLYGDEGDDRLDGGFGDDILYGGSGNDSLDGGGDGSDALYGGDGDDFYFFFSQVYEDRGGAAGGFDTVYVTFSYTLRDNFEKLIMGVYLESEMDLPVHTPIDGTGNDLDNFVLGNDYENVIRGLGGVDTIDGGSGQDILYGGDENDIIFGGSGYSYDPSQSRADSIYGGAGDDRLYGEDGNDRIYGGDGSDIMFGGSGTDELYGGLGDDVYNIASDTLFETTGGTSGGVDQVNAGTNHTLGANFENLTLDGSGTLGTGNSLNNVITGQGAAETLSGLGGNDTISGEGGADVIFGGDGVDLLFGGDGADVMYGGAGGDQMYGGLGDDVYNTALDTIVETTGGAAGGVDLVVAGTDFTLGTNFENLTLNSVGTVGIGNALGNVITGWSNAETLSGLDGDDFIYGGGGADVLSGGAGVDALYGGDGADVMYGGTGADQLYGGLGNDTYNTALDTIVEATGGAAGGVDLVVAGTDFTLGANFENLTLNSVGTNGIGNGLNNVITGWSNAETLSGLDGNDFIYGGAGNDTLRGGAGADDLTGSAGADVFFGGTNNDMFRFGLRTETPNGAGDRIRGESGIAAFEGAGGAPGDLVHLSAIDANETLSGNQTFAFGTSQLIGRLWAASSGTDTVIRGNVNNTAGHDFEIVIEDGGVLASAYVSSDFAL